MVWSDVFLILFQGWKTELNGLIEFLRRGQVDTQFETGVGILVVLCGRVDT
jgi:hypothetical protein